MSYLAQGQALEALGKDDDALGVYFMAMLDPQPTPEIELRMLVVLTRLDRVDEALALAEKLEARGIASPTIDAAKANALTARARSLREAGDRAGALVVALQVTRLAPTWQEGWFELGTDYKALGRLAEAIDAVARCVKLDPNQGDGWYNLACYRARAGDQRGAIEALGWAVSLAPANAKLAVEDDDFAALRSDEKFIAITA